MRRSPSFTELPRYPVTAGTAMLAIGITIAWWAKMDFSSLFESAMIRRGELWRLVTCIFPDLNIWHLAFNVYWLWVLGTLIEQVYGHLRTVALILLFAIGSVRSNLLFPPAESDSRVSAMACSDCSGFFPNETNAFAMQSMRGPFNSSSCGSSSAFSL